MKNHSVADPANITDFKDVCQSACLRYCKMCHGKGWIVRYGEQKRVTIAQSGEGAVVSTILRMAGEISEMQRVSAGRLKRIEELVERIDAAADRRDKVAGGGFGAGWAL